MSKYIRNSEGHYVCPHCDKVTEKQNTMYYHIKKNHDKDLPFECKVCESCPKFLQKSAYMHHMATNHPDVASPDGEKNPYAGVEFNCPSCEHKTHTKSNMLIHYARTHCKVWIPSFSKKTNCSGCSKSFASSSAYYYHSIACHKEKAPADYESVISRIK